MNLEYLPPQHMSLLAYDFEEMGEASPSERQYWIAEMEAATSAADHVHHGAEQLIHSRHGAQSSQFTRASLIVAVTD